MLAMDRKHRLYTVLIAKTEVIQAKNAGSLNEFTVQKVDFKDFILYRYSRIRVSGNQSEISLWRD